MYQYIHCTGIKARVNRESEFITATIASSMASFCPTINPSSIPSTRIVLAGNGRTGAVVPASRDTKFTETACNSYIYRESETPLPSRAKLASRRHRRRSRTRREEKSTRVRFTFFLLSRVTQISNHEAARGLHYRV